MSFSDVTPLRAVSFGEPRGERHRSRDRGRDSCDTVGHGDFMSFQGPPSAL